MKIKIEKMGINGEGIGYYNRLPIFVDGALSGEIVECKISEKHKTYAKATLSKIINKSKNRIEPKCKYFEKCGGCQLLHLDYGSQLKYKRDMVIEALYKYADIKEDLVEDIIQNDSPYAYRNSLKLPVTFMKNKLVSGLYEPGSNYLTKVDECLIHEKGIEKVKKNILNVLNKYSYSAYNRDTKKGIKGIFVRKLEDNYQACLVTGNDIIYDECINDLKRISGLKSLYQSIHTTKSHEFFGNQMIHLFGWKYIPFKFDGLLLNISIRSFFQLNTNQAKKMYHIIRDEVNDNQDFIFEAYAGIGAISLVLKDKAKKIIGVESIADAVNNANKNAKDNKINHVKFECNDASISLKKYAKKEKIDTLIVDPPRTGLDDAMLEVVMKAKISKIIYVSCNPSTLAKNLAVLKERYEIKKIIPLDIFSNSAHVETITVLERKTKKHFNY